MAALKLVRPSPATAAAAAAAAGGRAGADKIVGQSSTAHGTQASGAGEPLGEVDCIIL